MQIIPKIKVKRGEAVGNEILISFPELDTEYTFLTADEALGATTFTVENGLKFAIKEYIVTSIPGYEECEILRTHDSTAPTVSTITLNATVSVHAHSRGDKIQVIPYNKVVIYSSTDNVTFTTLTTIDIRPDAEETYYNHTTGTATTYYKVRFQNEATATLFSQYSDIVIATGYVANTAGAVIHKALISLGEEIDSEVLTKEFLLEALDEGRREIDEDERIIRWSFRTVFNYNVYSIIPGQYRIAVPTDLRDPDTNKNILSVKIGSGRPLDPVDQRVYDSYYLGVAHTTLDGAVLTADTEIGLTDSGDFEEDGSIDIAAQAVNEEIDNVLYEANDESTNEISTVTLIRTAGHADLTDVWQGANFGEPQAYTVDNDYIYFSQPFDDDLDAENVYLDYYKKIVTLDSDGDSLDEPFYTIYIPYLRYRIKLRKDSGLDWKNDPDFIKWVQMKNSQINKEYTGQDIAVLIDVP